MGQKYKSPFVPVLQNEQDTTYFSAAITSSSLESVTSYATMPSREDTGEVNYFAGFDYSPEDENENENEA